MKTEKEITYIFDLKEVQKKLGIKQKITSATSRYDYESNKNVIAIFCKI